MEVKCQNCNKIFNKFLSQIKKTSNNFCSRSCAAKYNNKFNKNIISNRKKKTKKCIICNEYILSDRKKCPKCINNTKPKDYTLKEATYIKHHKSSAFALIRSRARTIAKKNNMNKCSKCGYDKHVEIAHIKPISSFSQETKISIINDINNLIALCPNCHWEYDNL